jgi:hypothetical protein
MRPEAITPAVNRYLELKWRGGDRVGYREKQAIHFLPPVVLIAVVGVRVLKWFRNPSLTVILSKAGSTVFTPTVGCLVVSRFAGIFVSTTWRVCERITCALRLAKGGIVFEAEH